MRKKKDKFMKSHFIRRFKERFNIDWQSPQDKNPNINFD